MKLTHIVALGVSWAIAVLSLLWGVDQRIMRQGAEAQLEAARITAERAIAGCAETHGANSPVITGTGNSVVTNGEESKR